MTSCAGLQMFMEKLRQLIKCNDHDHPLITNKSVLRKRPQFQLLHDDLGSVIQTLFIDDHQDLHELEKVNDLKKRFIHEAEEAQYIVDLFLSVVYIRKSDDAKRSFKSLVNLVLSCVHTRNKGSFLTTRDFKRSLSLVSIRKSFKSVEEEFMSMRIDKTTKMDSSRRAKRTLNQSVVAVSKKLLEEVVGFDGDAEKIRDKLVEDQKKLTVVSIVGMGGIGKTTLATKVFNDGYVRHHFHVRVWVTVSQTYDKRDVLIQILESIRGQLDLGFASDSRLHELVHKHLMGKRFFIVIDDIWHIETWDNLKLYFPHDNNGSRILLTSRLTEVAKHATSDGFIHHLGCLNKERSWELLCQKVFYGDECPDWSIKPGMQIVENCQGLPLALVVIAGIIAKEAWNEEFWVQIADQTGSYIVGDQNGSIMESLGLSYNHLPLYLRECFLYLGGFPEDYKFRVRGLIWLWVAEGFIQQDGDRSLEDIAECYLMDLVARNLVIVAHKSNSNGAVKVCILHDLVRELCLRKAKEEGFILQTEILKLSALSFDAISPWYKLVRMFINKDAYNPEFAHMSARNLRSILCFGNFRSLCNDFAKYFHSFLLLRVLDIQKCLLDAFPQGMGLLVHLRYLAVWISSHGFPSSMCNLWGLQTLIYITEEPWTVILPNNISDLVNLRHLRSLKGSFTISSLAKPMKLETVSCVELKPMGDTFLSLFYNIKELTCKAYLDEETDLKYFEKLTYLEKLKLTALSRYGKTLKTHITFPPTLH